jgi:Raf kinase inhibitor-like YbhB/YbcL family protein
MATPVDGPVDQDGDLELTSSAFDDAEQLPDWTGYANANENPPLAISGVPVGAESLVLVMDDPDAEPVVGHVWDHWLVWDLDPDTVELPRSWDGDGATIGFNDYPEAAYGGPAPPEGWHTYHFKLYALDTELGLPPEARKARVGSAIALEADVLAATQLRGTYDASQGTIF